MSEKKWKYDFTKEAKKDFKKLAGNQKKIVLKALDKVVQNPLPHNEGGYGIPLGNKHGFDLTGCCEVKLRGQNLRIIYKLEKDRMIMLNIAIDERGDYEAYKTASGRL
ncbi:MAG: type II toxin-antitoxin system RelE/ParE family toxin [Erysipelotrichaceae bacterium]|nr:type II toxin-antitoxin system RelE/ParE family toxin [Erysipelotrichaceae bacterium]